MTEEQLQREINLVSNLTASLGQKYAGLLNIYNSTCIVGNKKDMDNMRGQMHNCLDEMLDAHARLFMLTRKATGLDS